ncbi:penicillin-binding transpeptidase domain-containing protein, partial [Elusimicrobiota bacterium]
KDMDPDMVWIPKNYDNKYLGPISLRTALARSRNLVSVKLIDMFGPTRAIELARRAGITSRLDAVLSLGLGTGEVSLLGLTGAYQAIANLGILAKPYSIESITESTTGEILENNAPILSEALPPAPTFVLIDAMKSVVKYGTARSISWSIKQPLAGKTGTTQDNRDLWFIGFAPEVTAGAWMGYDNFGSLGKKASGGTTVVLWWRQVMKQILRDYRNIDFGPPPEGIVFAAVCEFNGKLSRRTCPKVNLEVFLKDNSPQEFCDEEIHEREPLVVRSRELLPDTTGMQTIILRGVTLQVPIQPENDPQEEEGDEASADENSENSQDLEEGDEDDQNRED